MIARFLLALLGLTAYNDHEEIWQQALENPDLVGGDMLIPHDMILGNAIADENYRWPDAKIPYVIDNSLNSQKKLIKDAMEHYHKNTCVRFVERKNEKIYVRIYKGNGCFSAVGRNKTYSQPQPLSLGTGCYNIGTAIHELGHTLGFYHEQNRSDRDKYLNVYLDNVKPGMKLNFIKLKPSQNIFYNAFDYDSIMIYGNYAFSKSAGQLKTMEAKEPGHLLLNPYTKTRMTASDIQRVNKMYNCKGY